MDIPTSKVLETYSEETLYVHSIREKVKERGKHNKKANKK